MITDFILHVFSIIGSVLFILLGYAFNLFLRLIPLILLFSAFLTVRIILSKKFEKTAKMKGHIKVHAFAICFWLGLPGYIYVACLPDLKTARLKKIAKKLIELGEEEIPPETAH